ncbi:MAG: mannosyltransferase family protein [Thermoanaerobaculia bacterium]
MSRRAWMIGVVFWAALLHGVALLSLANFGPVRPGGVPLPGVSARALEQAPFARWDSHWYARVAIHGYEGGGTGSFRDTAYFPLYPALLAGISRATGLHPFVAGEAVSLLCLLGAAALLFSLAREEGFDPDATLRALLFFPTAFFFLACYTESLFLLTTVGSLLALRRRRYAASAAWGLLAGLTRPTGFLLVLPMLWEARERKNRAGALLAATGPLAGTGAFAIYLWVRFGSPMTYVRAQRTGWRYHLAWPWRPFIEGWRWNPTRRASVLAAILVGALGLWMLKRFTGYALYVLGSLALIIERGNLSSAVRYAVVLFPIFFLLGEAMRRSPAIERLYTVAGLLGLAVYTTWFAVGIWVG